MPFSLDKIFTTITANPFRKGNYFEIEPCKALKPYIRCFWGSLHSRIKRKGENFNTSLVIPDICMGIIITANTDGNQINSGFCGINNAPYVSEESADFCFGIRFYAWSVVLFSDEKLNGILNIFSDVKEHFSGFTEELSERIYFADNIYERKAIAEKYLLRKINVRRENSDIMNCVYYIINRSCNANVTDLSDYCYVSKRQLERKFLENTGVSPKQMINLIRYQLLWQESLKSDFNILNSVEKFGYCDQSHLLRDFKKYHGMPLGAAQNSVIK